LSAVQTSVSTTPLVLVPNLRTVLDPAGLPARDQSLATTTKIHRQLAAFPDSHTWHDPRNNRQPALPRWRQGPLTQPITTQYRLFGGLGPAPTQITLMDTAKRPYSRESADNAVRASAGGLAITTWLLAQLWLSSCTSDRAYGLWQSNGFSPPGPPGNSGRSSATPAA
jgi:hypothetical protein